MNQALGMAANTVDGFIKAHPGCFPPVVIHITDGESTDERVLHLALLEYGRQGSHRFN